MVPLQNATTCMTMSLLRYSSPIPCSTRVVDHICPILIFHTSTLSMSIVTVHCICLCAVVGNKKVFKKSDHI